MSLKHVDISYTIFSTKNPNNQMPEKGRKTRGEGGRCYI